MEMMSDKLPPAPPRYNMVDRIRRIDSMLPPTFHQACVWHALGCRADGCAAQDLQLVVEEIRHRFRLQAAALDAAHGATQRELELAKVGLRQVRLAVCSAVRALSEPRR
jgi:hypothetical protein